MSRVEFFIPLSLMGVIMAMLKKTYSITKTLDQYVSQRIKSGEYATDCEYVRELIRRDQDENQQIAG